eukprot:scaffold165641_cov18-Tisochrysis_lutea.AAC.1
MFYAPQAQPDKSGGSRIASCILSFCSLSGAAFSCTGLVCGPTANSMDFCPECQSHHKHWSLCSRIFTCEGLILSLHTNPCIAMSPIGRVDQSIKMKPLKGLLWSAFPAIRQGRCGAALLGKSEVELMIAAFILPFGGSAFWVTANVCWSFCSNGMEQSGFKQSWNEIACTPGFCYSISSGKSWGRHGAPFLPFALFGHTFWYLMLHAGNEQCDMRMVAQIGKDGMAKGGCISCYALGPHVFSLVGIVSKRMQCNSCPMQQLALCLSNWYAKQLAQMLWILPPSPIKRRGKQHPCLLVPLV